MKSTRLLSLFWCAWFFSLGALTMAMPARAEVDSTPAPVSPEVEGHSGAYATTVPIGVPSHPVAPALDLSYSSLRGNGRLGIGWYMAGFPAVVRQGATGGLPLYDATDAYALGGSTLIECGSSQAASCQAGGTHFAEVADYQRIVREADGSWTVTSKDGTHTRYTATFETSLGTLRWGIETVTDTLGNEASYSWISDGTDDCYPDKVTFGGYEVELVWDPNRVDEVTFATGAGLGRSAWRLSAIVVRVAGGDPIRVYDLGYGGNSIGSALMRVKIHGKDAVFSNWSVVGGTALPPRQFSYTLQPGSDFSGEVVTADTFCDVAWYGAATVGTGDFNGDAYQDLYCHVGGGAAEDTRHTWIATSNGDGTFTVGAGWDHGCQKAKNLRTGDFDGDGLTDFLCQGHKAPWKSEVSLNHGDGTFSSFEDWGGWCKLNDNPNVAFGVADVDGDGKTDWYCHFGYADGVGQPLHVGVSDGTGFSVTTWDPGFCTGDFFMGPDLNGDGMADAVCTGGGNKAKLSTGTALGYQLPTLFAMCGGGSASTYGSGDFNADGKADLWCKRTGNASVRGIYMAYSTGSDWHSFGRVESAVCNNMQPEDRFVTGDFNGDGRTDFLCHDNSTLKNQVLMHIDDGESLLYPGWSPTGCDLEVHNDARELVTGDFDGDGKTDLGCTERSGTEGTVTFRRWGETRGKDWLLTGMVSPYGGQTEIEYTPGSDWDNTHGTTQPTVSAITVSDGRGWSKRTTYAYSGYLMDFFESRSLGFRYRSVQQPALPGELQGPMTETWFIQDYATPGRVEWRHDRDTEGDIVSAVNHEYFVDGDGETEPFVALRTGTWSYDYDGSGNACPSYPCAYGDRRYTHTDYDLELGSQRYGNPRWMYRYGDDGTVGDESTTEVTYVPNAAVYVVGAPAVQTTWYGVGPGGALLRQNLTYYDGASTWNAPPSTALVSQRLEWLSTTGGYIGGCPTGVCVEYDAAGNVTKAIDPFGYETVMTYDGLHRETSVTNALGQTRTIDGYQDGCGASQTTDLNGQQTTTSYDALCRPLWIGGPDGQFVSFDYSALDGNPASQYAEIRGPTADGSGDLWTRRYFDGLGRVYKTLAKGPSAGQELLSESGARNARGHVTQRIADRYQGEPAHVAATYSYDAHDRVVRTDFPDGAYTQTVYGLRSTRVIDENGRETRSEVSADRLTSTLTEDATGSAVATTTSNDPVARATTLVDSAGNTWVTTRDSLGRILAQDDPDHGLWFKDYDAMGRVETETDALGQTTMIGYDALGRVTTKTTEDGTVNLTYDQPRPGYFNAGQLTAMTDLSGTSEMDYDVAGRTAQERRTVDGVTYKTSYTYDAGGRLLTETYPDGYLASYGYDGAGRPRSIAGVVDDTTYNTLSTVTQLANGVTTTATASQQRGWLDSIHTTNGSSVLQDFTYDRDPSGRISGITSPLSGENWAYEYDDLYRLTLADNLGDDSQDRSLAYDDLGNITFKSDVGSYDYPPSGPGSVRPHAVTTADGQPHTYDDNGQMLTGAGRTMTWNADHRPAAIDGESYVYDGLGQRVEKTDASGTTLYLGNVEVRPDGTHVDYVGPAKREDGVWYWIHSDHLGSAHVLTDATGAEVQRRGYAPLGDRTDATAHTESRAFIGQVQDDTGLMYLNARYYDPVLGRFLSPDPFAGDGQALNRYAYSRNDPVNLSDPSGLMPQDCPVVGIDPKGNPIYDCGFTESVTVNPEEQEDEEPDPEPFDGHCDLIPWSAHCRGRWDGIGGNDADDTVVSDPENDPIFIGCGGINGPPCPDKKEEQPTPTTPPTPNGPEPGTCGNGKAAQDCPGGFRFRLKYDLSDVVKGLNQPVFWKNGKPGPEPMVFLGDGLRERVIAATMKDPMNSRALYVFAHGNEFGVYKDNRWVPPLRLASEIAATEGYQRGMPVCLFSCQVGQGDYAQELANLLNAPVIATQSYGLIHPLVGNSSVPGFNSDWIYFYPVSWGRE